MLALPEGFDPARLPPEALAELLELLEAEQLYRSRRLLFALYPEHNSTWTGDFNKDMPSGATIYARHLYPKHMEFFRAGATYSERCAMCANRIGKTFGMGGYECALHLTGEYPDWWPGHRFTQPIRAWACGKNFETTRDIVQATLMGEVVDGQGGRKSVSGTGLIPYENIAQRSLTWKSGVSNLIDTVKVKHKTGGFSLLGLKSYQQGRDSFEGVAQHFIWDDEEPDEHVYGEQLIRTATTNGLMAITFTPLLGISAVVKSFLPGDMQLEKKAAPTFVNWRTE
jgi:phage terminase large subunit-like protein